MLGKEWWKEPEKESGGTEVLEKGNKDVAKKGRWDRHVKSKESAN